MKGLKATCPLASPFNDSCPSEDFDESLDHDQRCIQFVFSHLNFAVREIKFERGLLKQRIILNGELSLDVCIFITLL